MRAEITSEMGVRVRRATSLLFLSGVMLGSLVGAGCSTIREPLRPDEVVASIGQGQPEEMNDAVGRQAPDVAEASLAKRRLKDPLKKRLAVAPVRIELVENYGRSDSMALKGGAGGSAGASAGASAGGSTGASTNGTTGGSTGSGTGPGDGSGGGTGGSAAPVDAPKADATKQGAMLRRPVPRGQAISTRYRRLQDGAWVASLIRRPLYQEILFSPQGDGEAAGTAKAPSATPLPGDIVEFLCPRCNESVGEADAMCPRCGLAFAPEDVPTKAPGTVPDVIVDRPAGASTGESTAASTGASASTGATSAVARKAESYVCFQCAKPVSLEQESCENCGIRFDAPGATPVLVEGGDAEKRIGATDAGTVTENSDRGYATVTPEAAKLQDLFAATVRSYKVFDDVVAVKNKEELTNDQSAMLSYAAAGDVKGPFDFLMIPTVKQWQITYAKQRPFPFAGGLFFWVAIGEPLPNAWFALEQYRIDVVVDFQMFHVRSGKEIVKDTHKAEYSANCDSWDRGWYPWSIVAVPAANLIRDAGWRYLSDSLSPVALNEIQKKLCQESLYNQFARRDWEEIEAKTPEVVALLVDCEQPDPKRYPGVRPLNLVTQDVELVEKVLRERYGLRKYPEYQFGNRFARFDTKTATKDNLTKWFDEVLPRLSPNDTAIIYFSGYGAIEYDETLTTPDKHEKYLVLYDSDPTDLKRTGFSLTALQERLRDVPVKNVILALDCSFGAEPLEESLGFGRSLVRVKGQKMLPGLEDRDQRDARLGDRTNFPVFASFDDFGRRGGGKACLVLTAADQDQAAMEYPKLGASGQGLFTHFFARGLAGEADRDGDAALSTRELTDFVAREVRRVANVAYGLPQEVRIMGSINATFFLPLRGPSIDQKSQGTKAPGAADKKG